MEPEGHARENRGVGPRPSTATERGPEEEAADDEGPSGGRRGSCVSVGPCLCCRTSRVESRRRSCRQSRGVVRACVCVVRCCCACSWCCGVGERACVRVLVWVRSLVPAASRVRVGVGCRRRRVLALLRACSLRRRVSDLASACVRARVLRCVPCWRAAWCACATVRSVCACVGVCVRAVGRVCVRFGGGRASLGFCGSWVVPRVRGVAVVRGGVVLGGRCCMIRGSCVVPWLVVLRCCRCARRWWWWLWLRWLGWLTCT